MTYNYKNLSPFKFYILQNFPYIEEDFDAITNWQLFCKLGEEINKIINTTNLTGEQVENLTNAFNDLTNYVNNYFENLDVQDEINNKLDDMAESGELAELITAYLNAKSILAYNTIQEMSLAENIINGSFLRTYGKLAYNDGLGSFYKARLKLETDVIDNDNIVALSDTTLIAEKIPDANINTILQTISNLEQSVVEIENNIEEIKAKKTMIVIGDSFSASTQSGTPLWYNYVSKALNLNVYTNASDGQGYGTGTNNFLTQLQTANNYFADKSVIDRIYIIGGLNDLNNTTEMPDDLSFSQYVEAVFNYVNQYFSNIPVYVYGILPFQFYNYYGNNVYLSGKRATKFTEMLSFKATEYGMIFTQCSSFGLFLPNYFGDENSYNQRHPSSIGEKAIANLILTGQRFYGIRNINNNNQTPALNTSIPIVDGLASSVEIIGTDLNYIYLRINNYQNTQDLNINLDNLPINLNSATTQYQFLVTDEFTSIFAWTGNLSNTVTIPANRLASGTLYMNIPFNSLW